MTTPDETRLLGTPEWRGFILARDKGLVEPPLPRSPPLWVSSRR